MVGSGNPKIELALALLVAGIGAYNIHFALPTHDFAILANALNARSNFHGRRSSLK